MTTRFNSKKYLQLFLGMLIAVLLIPGVVAASEVTGSITSDVESSSVGGTVVVTPSFSPAAATYTSARSVTLAARGSSRIYYTADGTTPACGTGSGYSGAVGTVYTGSFTVNATATVKARACYLSGSTIHASSVSSATYTIHRPSSSGGGGGSTSGRSTGTTTVTTSSTGSTTVPTTTTDNAALIANLRAQLSILMQQLAALTGGGSSSGGTPTMAVRDLESGMEGLDVKALQQILIAQNSGPKAVELKRIGDTAFFGTYTYDALIEYQRAKGLPGSGYFGPQTRAQMKAAGVVGIWW